MIDWQQTQAETNTQIAAALRQMADDIDAGLPVLREWATETSVLDKLKVQQPSSVRLEMALKPPLVGRVKAELALLERMPGIVTIQELP